MKITMKANLTVLGVTANKWTKDGEDHVSYKISLADADGQCGMYPCSEAIAQSVSSDGFKKMTEHEVTCSYDDQKKFSQFVIESVK